MRWARRHRTLVISSAVLLLTAVAALTVTAVLVSKEKAQTEKQRRLAEDNFQTALHAVDDMLTEVSQEQLAPEPRMEKKRRALLERARSYYQQFLQQHGDDPRVRKEAALAHKRLGDVSRLLGEHEQAREAYGKAIALSKPLIEEHPERQEYRAALAETYCNLGESWRLTTHPGEAQDAYDHALRLQRRLVEEAPERPVYRKDLARTQYNRGLLFASMRRPQDADEALAEAVGLGTRLAGEHPKEPLYRQHLARALLNRGPVLREAGRIEDAESAYREAIRLQKELIAEDPDTPDYRYELGVSYINFGVLYVKTGRADKAKEAYGEAISRFERLTLDFPSVPVYHEELARAQSNLAVVLAGELRWDEAERAWGQALASYEKLAARHPDVTDYQGYRGLALGNLGWLLLRRQKVQDVGAAALGVGSGGPLGALAALACCGQRRERLTLACQRLQDAAALMRVALKPNPANPRHLQPLRDQTEYLAEARLALGDHAAAAEAANTLPAIFGTRGDDYAVAAELLSRCSAVASADPELPPDRRAALSASYADRAVEMVCRGIANGLDAGRLDGPAFAPLQGRDDFRALRASKGKKP
jgi:tetratricopeptide (TPR) repeat protein